jgi:hypothetical protein
MKSILAVAAASVFTLTLSAQETTVYNSIPNPLPGNVKSEGLEADGLAELGDALSLTGPVGALHQVTVVLSSWACQSGGVYAGNCASNPGATFNQSVTMNIYAVGDPGTLTPGTPLATLTDTFSIPYRPTAATPAQCNGDVTAWYNSKDQKCYHGIAAPITFNFTNQHIALPQQVIVTVAYNTTHYGPHPIGESAACFKTGCPYDSLNISTDTDSSDGNFVLVGGTLNTTGIVARNAGGFEIFPEASNLHPEIQISGNQNGVPGKQKSALPR